MQARIRYALRQRMIAQNREVRERSNLIREQFRWRADRGMEVLLDDD